MIPIVILFLVCLGLAGLYVHRSMIDQDLMQELLKRIDDLQADNRALTEALVRVEGKPLVFRKTDPVDADGWFDSKKVTNGNDE